MKLSMSDIEILTEGQQIKKAILEEYDSIEDFVIKNKVPMYVESVKNYLRRSKVNSTRFKCNLTLALGKGYDEIVLSKDRQIMRNVRIVSDHIEEYTDERDLELLEALKDMCRKESLPVGTAMMYRAMAIYHLNQKNYDGAAVLLKLAIDILENKGEKSLLTGYFSELGNIYYSKGDQSKAKKIFESIELQLLTADNIDNKTLFLYNYRSGLLYCALNKHELARRLFERSLLYAEDKRDLGRATLYVGLTYKNQKKYTEALDYYYKALECLDLESVSDLCLLYRLMAEVFEMRKNESMAVQYIERTFEYINHPLGIDSVAFDFYAKIHLQKGQTGRAVAKLRDLCNRLRDLGSGQKFVMDGIYILLDYMKKEEDTRLAADLESLTVYLLGRARNIEGFQRALYAVLGVIYSYKKKWYKDYL